MDPKQPVQPTTTKTDPLTDGTYIRTFAKDVAKLTGKPIQMGKVVVPKAELSPPKPKKTLEEELTPETETLDAQAFAATRTGAFDTASPIDAARSEILSRLKSKVKIEVPSVPKVEPPPPPPVVRAEAPPPIPLASKSEPQAGPSPIHTFKSDFADKTKKEHASKLSVLAAEGDSARTKLKPVRQAANVNIVAIAVGAVLILGGGAGIFFAIKFATTAPIVPADTTPSSLIFADSKTKVAGQGRELMQALSDAAQQALPDKSVVVAYITESSTSTAPLPGGALIAALALPAPDILLRNIDEVSTVGIVRAGSETRPFFVLRVSSYESTFAGMLAWEDTMSRDLSVIYPPYATASISLPADTASTTATSSTPKGQTIIIPQAVAPTSFVDEVVANHDVRVLYDAQHRSLLLYGYRDKDTLVIARDKAAFATLLDRLSSTSSQ